MKTNGLSVRVYKVVKPHTAFCSAEVLVNSPASLEMHTMSGWGNGCVCVIVSDFLILISLETELHEQFPRCLKNPLSVALNCLEERGVMFLRPDWIWTCSSWNMSNHLAMAPIFLPCNLAICLFIWHIIHTRGGIFWPLHFSRWRLWRCIYNIL